MRDTQSKSAAPTHIHKGFIVFYQHVNDEPAMVIGSRKVKRAWVIPLSQSYRYADSKSGEPTPYLIRAAARIGDLLSLGTDRATVFNIASAIVDDLPDLIRMPPAPPPTKRELDNQADTAGLVVQANGDDVLGAA